MSPAAGVALLAVVALGSICPSIAPAYVVEGKPAPELILTYHNAARRHDWAVERAVAAWNESGADVVLLPSSRAEATVRISLLPGVHELAGETSLTETEGEQLRRRAAKVLLPELTPDEAREERFSVALIAAHELGHVLGLGHEDGGCALMNSFISEGAPAECDPPPPGYWRCRLLERDDVEGVISLYGGRPRRIRRSPFCPTEPPPPPPAAFAPDPQLHTGRVRLSWSNPDAPRLRQVLVDRAPGVCPSSPEGPGLKSVAARRGDLGSVTYPLEPRAYCYRAWTRDRSGRLSRRPATLLVPAARVTDPPTRATVERPAHTLFDRSFAVTSLRWRNPRSPLLQSLLVTRRPSGCSSPAGGPPRLLRPTGVGELQRYVDFRLPLATRGRPCFVLRAKDRLGRLSSPVHVSIPRA
jgi:hypothetical protein